MKTIFLIRHAKSSWAAANMRDFDRPLELRGHNDAPRMAKHLKQLGFQPDLIVSSPAMRAKTTAAYFADAFGIPLESIDYQQDIYEANEEDIENVIRELPEEAQTVLIFGHNPTFTYVADAYSKIHRFDNISTCGIVQIEAYTEGSLWKNFHPNTAEVKAFWYPKTI
jgi:phosphohistidine phosphatase